MMPSNESEGADFSNSIAARVEMLDKSQPEPFSPLCPVMLVSDPCVLSAVVADVVSASNNRSKPKKPIASLPLWRNGGWVLQTTRSAVPTRAQISIDNAVRQVAPAAAMAGYFAVQSKFLRVFRSSRVTACESVDAITVELDLVNPAIRCRGGGRAVSQRCEHKNRHAEHRDPGVFCGVL